MQDTGSFSSQKELGFSFIKRAEVSIEEANIAIGPNYNSETGEDFYVLALYDYSFPDANEIIKANIIYYKVPLKD